MPVIAIYVRVSTQRQAQSQSIEQQLERLQAYVLAQDWDLASEHMTDCAMRSPALGSIAS